VRREKVLELVPDNTKVIDIASGPGIMVEGLQKKGCMVTCVDAAPEMIAITKKEHPKTAAVVGDAYDLPFDHMQFDVALAMGLIEYLEHEERFLAEAARVLKRNGLLIITFPNAAAPWRLFNNLAVPVIRLIRMLTGKKKGGSITHREYTLRRAEKLLLRSGFTTETIRSYNFKLVPYPFDVWFPLFTVAQSKLFEYLDRTPLRWIGTAFIVSARKK
jgi:ubiquinone/menaquinone biosynthesis C-methylase UbiE